MSSERPPAIRVRGLGKRYRVAALQSRHNTLRDHLAGAAREAWNRATRALRGRPAPGAETIWALRDIDFDIAPGEAVGVIGGNGAGKSTLLKLLSRITEPTEGRGEIRGRIGSLLEVGTGFHSELTGRENTFLNGAILGMRGSEIRRKFDAIVDFAGVERFIDTPVKFYSSGMYLRLAFAVAAHMDPDILVVDEVLAVGDHDFRARCLQKMHDISAGEGRTVLFVSHDMGAIRRLCGRCLLLSQGRLIADGETSAVVRRHLTDTAEGSLPARWIEVRGVARAGTGEATFRSLRLRSDRAETAFQPYRDGPLTVDVDIASDVDRVATSLAVTLYDQAGNKLVNADSTALAMPIPLRAGSNRYRVAIRAVHLNPGMYTLGLWLSDGRNTPLDYVPRAFHVEVVEADEGPEGARPDGDGTVSCDYAVEPLSEGGEAIPEAGGGADVEAPR
jgi:lipopolysaccharide transport system ATP-binding protein